MPAIQRKTYDPALMTVVSRRLKPAAVQTRRRRLPLDQRFPIGCKVAVIEDFSDKRYAERKGNVRKVHLEPDNIYPLGRVGVMLVYDELMHKLFGGKAPSIVWFKPSDLEKL